MSGFHSILVPLDGSKSSEAAIDLAMKAAAPGATITLYQVADLVANNYLPAGTDSEELWDSQLAPVQKYLAALAESSKQPGMNFSAVIGGGTPAEAIVDYAQKNSIELIVMCTHAQAGIRHFLLGSVTDKVVKTSHVPVMVLQP